jgi:hypothetical protein
MMGWLIGQDDLFLTSGLHEHVSLSLISPLENTYEFGDYWPEISGPFCACKVVAVSVFFAFEVGISWTSNGPDDLITFGYRVW